MKTLYLIPLLIILQLVGCKKDYPQSENTSSKQSVRVVGFRFDVSQLDFPDGKLVRRLLSKDGVDTKLLERGKLKEAVLTNDQVSILDDSIYGAHPVFPAASCYDPHHIFIFYNPNGKPFKAVEICFNCTAVKTYPNLEEGQWRKHDYRSLAKLCDDIGIGMIKGSAEDFIRRWDESPIFPNKQQENNSSRPTPTMRAAQK